MALTEAEKQQLRDLKCALRMMYRDDIRDSDACRAFREEIKRLECGASSEEREVAR